MSEFSTTHTLWEVYKQYSATAVDDPNLPKRVAAFNNYHDAHVFMAGIAAAGGAIGIGDAKRVEVSNTVFDLRQSDYYIGRNRS